MLILHFGRRYGPDTSRQRHDYARHPSCDTAIEGSAQSFLSIRSSGTDARFLILFHQGLKEGGFVEGRNVAVEHRFHDVLRPLRFRNPCLPPYAASDPSDIPVCGAPAIPTVGRGLPLK
jgi:hypothetical protein